MLNPGGADKKDEACGVCSRVPYLLFDTIESTVKAISIGRNHTDGVSR